MIRRVASLAVLAAVAATPALAQARRADFNWQGVVAAGGEVSLHNINGDIKVVPSTTGRVEVLGFKSGDAAYFDQVRVDVQPTSSAGWQSSGWLSSAGWRSARTLPHI